MSDCHGANAARVPLRLPGERRDLRGVPRRDQHELSVPRRNRPRHPQLAHPASGEYELVTKSGDDSWLYEEVTYPTYLTNCSVCHKTEAALAAGQFHAGHARGLLQLPRGHVVLGRHLGRRAGARLPRGMNESTDCTICHGPDALSELDTVAEMHNGLQTERVGIIWNGEDTSVTEATGSPGRSKASSTTARTDDRMDCDVRRRPDQPVQPDGDRAVFLRQHHRGPGEAYCAALRRAMTTSSARRPRRARLLRRTCT